MKFRQVIKIVVTSCCLVLLTALMASAMVQKERSALPITVKSNDMTADNKGKTAIFSGKVVARQGDITIYSDKLVVHYADAGGDVEKVEAVGSVRIVQQNRTGFAEQALYDSRNGRIILSGAPRVVQGGDSITGKVITYHLDDQRSEVSSGGDPKERVEVIINPSARKNDGGAR